MDIREILNHCDHTLLAQTATWEEIKAILDDGIKISRRVVLYSPRHL